MLTDGVLRSVKAKEKRVSLFLGHYGSGKTNIAVNYALHLRGKGRQVKIADLDIVNPYFRTKDSAADLENAGIELISPAFANSNVDLPSLPAEVYGLMGNRDFCTVLDIGGDDRGAYALGRWRQQILDEDDYEMFFVANFYRPLTTTAEEALEVMREIETAAGMKFTAIINNSNLGNETTVSDITGTFLKAQELSSISSLPIAFTCAKRGLAQELRQYTDRVFELDLQNKYFDIKEI